MKRLKWWKWCSGTWSGSLHRYAHDEVDNGPSDLWVEFRLEIICLQPVVMRILLLFFCHSEYFGSFDQCCSFVLPFKCMESRKT